MWKIALNLGDIANGADRSGFWVMGGLVYCLQFNIDSKGEEISPN